MYIHPVHIIILFSLFLAGTMARAAYLRWRRTEPTRTTDARDDELLKVTKRLQVLERIAVEKENSLAREIEELRPSGA